jgi:CRISPR system Cascade subunit CasE
MTALFLSRARLRRDGALAALARLLVPDDAAARTAAAHRLVWALFADGADRARDFLWREEAPGRFLTLSRRPPENPEGLFDLDTQAFAPALAAGDRLGFALRANPVVARPDTPGQRGRRHDVVMDALRNLPHDQRAAARLETAAEAGRAWFTRQGARHGFRPLGQPGVDGYQRIRIQRDEKESKSQKSGLVFGQLDIDGIIEVEDPARFLDSLAQGFGRARAFGCGLMLIRRVP